MRKLKLLNLALAGTFILSGVLGFSNQTAASNLGHDLADRAQDFIGYKITDFQSADFVSYVFEKEGVSVPDSLKELSKKGDLISSQSQLKEGDVLFFGTSASNLIATGIYVGNGEFIIAYKPYERIKRMNLNTDPVAKKYFLGAKRIEATQQTTQPGGNSKKPGWEGKADQVIAKGMKYLGVKYKLGADYNRDGTMRFDCSSFTQIVFKEAVGYDLQRSSRAQFMEDGSKALTMSQLRKGDLVFFATEHNYKKYSKGDYRRNGHVGIVKAVHSNGSIEVLHSFPGEGVILQKMEANGKNYLSKAFLYGKRIIADNGAEAKDVSMPKKGLTEGK